jgi:lysyl-tRNA synthetase class 2
LVNSSDWSPSASLKALQARADLNDGIRRFFRERGVLEVETPLMCRTTGTDPNLQPVTATCRQGNSPVTLYLQTSPEFAMKRLLAAGSGPIYQLCKAFRDGESGRRHNPEFTMLEWYRPGFTLDQLMEEVQALVSGVAGLKPARRLSYRALFNKYLDIDPFRAPDQALAALASDRLEYTDPDASRDLLLDLLYSHLIEPCLADPVFIHDYPASQAALARVETNDDGDLVGRRFELVAGGMELANGYDELCDPAEQARRFAADQALRQRRQLPVYEGDPRLVAALAHGMPAGAGVALGVDRLLMLILQTDNISDVLGFPFARA